MAVAPVFDLTLMKKEDQTLFESIPLFAASEWSLNGPNTAQRRIITTAPDGNQTRVIFHRKNDLIGIIWQKDILNHVGMSYEDMFDFTGVKWRFRLRLTGGLPLDDVNGMTLTVQHGDGRIWYIRLWAYIEEGQTNNRDAFIAIDWDNLYGGFPPFTDPSQKVDSTDIRYFFFGVIPTEYAFGNLTALTTPEIVTVDLSQMSVSGTGHTTLLRGGPVSGPHIVGIDAGLDDICEMTPERWWRNEINWGLDSWVTLYMGFSHYFNLVWDAARKDPSDGSYPANAPGSFSLDMARPGLNQMTREWLADWLKYARKYKINVIGSFSTEINGAFIPLDQTQRDFHVLLNGADYGIAKTGWSPFSGEGAHLSDLITVHLVQSGKDFIAAMLAAGFAEEDCWVQAGEHRTWQNYWQTVADGTAFAGEEQPSCFYDPLTQAAHQTELGRPLLIYKTAIDNDGTDAIPVYNQDGSLNHTGYNANDLASFDWLGNRLAASMAAFRDGFKATYPKSKFAFLFYTPEVFTTHSLQLVRVNYPHVAWQYPFADMLQVEDYGDVTNWKDATNAVLHPTTDVDKIFQYLAGDPAQNFHLRSITDVPDQLLYPKDKRQYFIGFVEAQGPPPPQGQATGQTGVVAGGPPEGETDDQFHARVAVQWPSIRQAGLDGYYYGYGVIGNSNVSIWASTQKNRDGVVLKFVTPPTPIPMTLIPTGFTLSKGIEMTQVPGVPGAIATESTWQPFELSYDGKLMADTPEELSAAIDDILKWFEGKLTIYYWPGRYFQGYVSQHTLDPQWVGVNATLVAFSFKVTNPEAVFYDKDGFRYRTP